MAMKVEKKSVSLPPETLAQLEWLKKNVLHAPDSVALSSLIQFAISLAYFKYQND